MYVDSGVTIYNNYDYSFIYENMYLIYARSQYEAKAGYNSYPTSHKLFIAPIDTVIPEEGLEFTKFRTPRKWKYCGDSVQFGPTFDEELRDRLAKEGKTVWEIKRIMDTKIVERYLYR